jgi:hypothetical protein
MRTLIDARYKTIEDCPGGAGSEITVTVSGNTFGGHSVVIKQHPVVLGHKTDRADDVPGGLPMGLRAADSHGATLGSAKANKMVEQR